MQVWNGTVEDNLKGIIDIAYTNKLHLLFGNHHIELHN